MCDAVQLEVADVGGGLHAPDEEAGLHLVQPRPGAGRHPAPVQQLRGVPQLRTSENIHNIFSRMQGKKKCVDISKFDSTPIFHITHSGGLLCNGNGDS